MLVYPTDLRKNAPLTAYYLNKAFFIGSLGTSQRLMIKKNNKKIF